MLINIHTHSLKGQSIEVLNRTFKDPINGYFSFGIHPFNSDSFVDSKNKLDGQLSDPHCIAVGEIGLDKLKGPTFSIQKNAFIEQLKIAEFYELPIILHCVQSWNEMKQIKRELIPKQPWIYHGFAKSSLLSDVLNEKVMISIGAAVLTNLKLQECISKIPNDQLFLETDDKSVTISEIYQKVSELKKLTLPQLEELIEQNFKRVFTKWRTGLNEQNY
jgi:TatD DNase family protein